MSRKQTPNDEQGACAAVGLWLSNYLEEKVLRNAARRSGLKLSALRRQPRKKDLLK